MNIGVCVAQIQHNIADVYKYDSYRRVLRVRLLSLSGGFIHNSGRRQTVKLARGFFHEHFGKYARSVSLETAHTIE